MAHLAILIQHPLPVGTHRTGLELSSNTAGAPRCLGEQHRTSLDGNTGAGERISSL